MVVMEVKNLQKAFGGRQAVDGVSFSVKRGEVFGLLGPNGAGKSTTLSMISGLLRPTNGSVVIKEWDISNQPQQAKAVLGVVPQEPAIYPQLSARANLQFFGEMHGLSGQELKKAIDQTLEVVGLAERADERSGKYSGGMKRRLNIAAGLIHSPQVLIMDEPTVGVDPQSRRHILDTVRQLKAAGMSVIYTSHYVEEVEALCDRVAVMDNGRIIAEGPIEDLTKQAGQFQELVITLSGTNELGVAQLARLPGVEDSIMKNGYLHVLTRNAEAVLPLVFETLVAEGLQVQEIKINKPNLESLFLKLTGRGLRD